MNTREPISHAESGTAHACVYCGKIADTKDHAPPRCLLRRPLPSNLITFPACRKCNVEFSTHESVVLTLLAFVSPHPEMIAARQPGGKVHGALERDARLRRILDESRQADGNYALTPDVFNSFERVLFKTVQGLFFGLYNRVVATENLKLDIVDNRRSVTPDAIAQRYRPSPMEDITDQPLSAITPSSWHTREPIFIMDLKPLSGEGPMQKRIFRLKRDTPIEWVDLQPGVFRFGFVKSDGEDSACVMELWETLVVAVKAPWPGDRGPLRKGRKNPLSRD